MTGNTEFYYWRTDKSWYVYDEATNTFSMTELAPERAHKSFELWLKGDYK